jgi:dTDP-4-dehydrorhamnose 3,5-epimerase
VIVRATELPDVLEIEARAFGDERGWFLESWHEARYRECGVPDRFVQDNVSMSRRHVLRGLHLQHPNGQGKLVGVLAGEVWDVAVDVRSGSPSFGRWVARTLSEENRLQLYIPPGFAHGFVVLSDRAIFAYKCTAPYDAGSELSVRWNDPELGIAWPVPSPQVSARDAAAPLLRAIPPSRLPPFAPS